MKVLMLSTDNKILEEGSEANLRMREYAGLFEGLYIVVANSGNPHLNPPPDYRGRKIEEGKPFIYSTNSGNKLRALWGAYKIGKKILSDDNVRLPRPRGLGLAMTEGDGGRKDWVITSQDAFELGLVGYLLKKKFGVPLQLQIHTDFLSPYFWHESLKNKIRVLLAKWLLPKADGVRVVSERIKKSLESSLRGFTKQSREVSLEIAAPACRQAGRSRTPPRNDGIVVLPIFVDMEKIKGAPVKTDLHKKYPQFDSIILMASRLSSEKNIGFAIEAMSEVAKRHPKAGLVIVGEGPETENQKSNIKYKKLEESIEMEPWTEDLASYCKTADLFLLTSNYEGYGRTIVEAMAAGLPVIMTDVGVAGDLVKDGQNGYVIDVGDKRGLAERVSKVIEDKALREEFSKNNLEAVKSLPNKEAYLREYKESISKIIV